MMTKETFKQWFLKEIQERWTACAFTAVQLADWHWRLNQYDEPTLTEAVRQHHAYDEPRRPSLKAVYEYARQLCAARAVTNRRLALAANSSPLDAGVPEAHTFIMCTAKDIDGCGPVGRWEPILILPLNRPFSKEIFWKTARCKADLYQQRSGGIWEVFTDSDDRQMRTRRSQLVSPAAEVSAASENASPAKEVQPSSRQDV